MNKNHDMALDQAEMGVCPCEGCSDQGCPAHYADSTIGGFERLQARIEEQAREIERLNREEKNDAIAYKAVIERQNELRTELAALKAQHEQDAQTIKVLQAMARQLKAQPSGVVLADDIRAACQNAVEVFGEEPNSAQCREVAEYMREVLLDGLNQPASGGEYGDAYQGARQDLAIWKRRALEAETKVREQDQIIENLGNAMSAGSGPTFMGEPVISHDVPVERSAMQRLFRACGCSGAVDNTQLVNLAANKLESKPASGGDDAERAAFETWYLGHFYMGDKQCGLEWLSTEPCGCYRHQHPAEQWIVWQARAALSANHSEQVRAVPVEPTEAMRKAAQDKLASEGLIVTDWLIHTAYSAMLAAAPAPSREGE